MSTGSHYSLVGRTSSEYHGYTSYHVIGDMGAYLHDLFGEEAYVPGDHLVLLSTSGTSGSYQTIDECVGRNPKYAKVTAVVVFSRTGCLVMGNAWADTSERRQYLRRIMDSSKQAFSRYTEGNTTAESQE